MSCRRLVFDTGPLNSFTVVSQLDLLEAVCAGRSTARCRNISERLRIPCFGVDPALGITSRSKENSSRLNGDRGRVETGIIRLTGCIGRLLAGGRALLR